MKVSLCMMTYNEEQNLPIILVLMKPIVDEICIADSNSTDRTIFIARQFGAKIVQHSYNNDAAAQRNRSVGLATGNWIFVLDGDEFPSIQLGFHLKLIAKEAEAFGYDTVAFNRLNYTSGVFHNDKPGEQKEDMHIRLFKKHLRYAGWHLEGVTNYKNLWSLPMYHFYHCKSLEGGVWKHEEHRKWGLPVFPFPKWFQEIFEVTSYDQ